MKGYIHSFETFGTKDGPGIRFIVFLQGCLLRCLYCHNPDTWKANNYEYEMTPEEVYNEFDKVKSFVRGGITLSGGEPMFQADFALELFKICKANNIHTTIDTSGFIFNDKVKEVLEYTDLVLLDIKHIDNEKHITLTGKPIENTLNLLNYLNEINKPVWARYVLVPGYSDDENDLKKWAEYVSQYKNVERVELLPFHQMGMSKWEQLGETYQLADTKTPSVEDVQKAEQIFRSYNLPLP